MLMRFVIALVAIIILESGNILYTGSVAEKGNDKEQENVLSALDHAIVIYYCNHSGNLPEDIEEETRKAMGLERLNSQVDWSKYSYSKDEKEFTLSTVLSTGKTVKSAHSDQPLQDWNIDEYVNYYPHNREEE